MTEASGHERRGAGEHEDDVPVSLYPLDFEEALRGLLAVDPRSVPDDKGGDDGDGS